MAFTSFSFAKFRLKSCIMNASQEYFRVRPQTLLIMDKKRSRHLRAWDLGEHFGRRSGEQPGESRRTSRRAFCMTWLCVPGRAPLPARGCQGAPGGAARQQLSPNPPLSVRIENAAERPETFVHKSKNKSKTQATGTNNFKFSKHFHEWVCLRRILHERPTTIPFPPPQFLGRVPHACASHPASPRVPIPYPILQT